ncbi:MAG: transporter [Alphaproteobacteria bacterium]|jgi:NitT/TauT family transport system ATP-binding protein|nr:transporter [Alphaproteobacteria bacterium]
MPQAGSNLSIDVRALSQTFVSRNQQAPVLALDRIDLQVPRGQFVAFIGPSGCGKTTLLNIIAGLIQATEGRCDLDGTAVTGPRRSTGYMFARPALLPWRTARANVELPLEFRGVDRSERSAEAQRLLSLVGLTGFEESFPSQLSQGMRQRVGLARTLAFDPSLLLLDEPFAALDAQTKLLVQQEFIRIWEKSRQTVIFVTHDLNEALALADRVIVFSRRPGRFKTDVPIDLPRPRDLVNIRLEKRFLELYDQLWSSLRDEFLAPEEAVRVAS